MKKQLQLCSLALNPAAPSPTAQMVKVEDGLLQAFGGTFCIRVPVDADIGCCFSPKSVSAFFRKERKGVSFTVKDGKLSIKEGKETMRVKCLPPDEMPTIDMLGDMQETDFDVANLKLVVDGVDPSANEDRFQGIQLRYGAAEATNRRVVVAVITDLPDDIECILPVDAAKALLRFASPLAGIGFENGIIKFGFEDGSSLTSRTIDGEFPDMAPLFQHDWTPVSSSKAVAEELLSFDCERVIYERRTATAVFENKDRVVFEDALKSSASFTVNKRYLDLLLKNNHKMNVNSTGNLIMTASDICRVISTTLSS